MGVDVTDETVTAEFFLHVVPVVKKGRLTGIKADRITQTLQGGVDAGAQVVKMNVSLPRAVFDPYVPEVTVDITPDLVEAHTVAGSIPVLDEERPEMDGMGDPTGQGR